MLHLQVVVRQAPQEEMGESHSPEHANARPIAHPCTTWTRPQQPSAAPVLFASRCGLVQPGTAEPHVFGSDNYCARSQAVQLRVHSMMEPVSSCHKNSL